MTAVYPMYVVQNRLLVSPTGYYKGMLDCFARCYKEEGLRVFSQSYTVSSVRILPYKGIDMGLYGFMREKLVSEGEIPSVPLSLVMGGSASCVSQTVTNPLPLARTGLQCQGGFGREIIYNNFVEVLSQTYSTGGFTSLFRGLFPSMCKNVPAVAIQFAVFEKAIGFFGDNIEIK